MLARGTLRAEGSRTMRTCLLAVTAAAVLGSTACSVTSGPLGTDDGVSFSYDSLGSMSIPIAAGASDGISISVPSGTTVASAKASDPSVLSLGTLNAGSLPGSYDVPVIAGNPGSTTFTIYDPSGKEIDHTTVQVAPTTSIPLDMPSGVTLLSGNSFAVHATTIGDGGQTLAGTGSIHFAYQGSLSPTTGAPDFCSGDCGYFQAGATGDGEIDAAATSATARSTVHVVDASALDAFSFASPTLQMKQNDGQTITYTMRAGSVIVYGSPSCTSSDEQVASFVFGAIASPGNTTSGTLAVGSTSNPGTATITCTAGQNQATLVVTVK
jgi:hypothetical protein